MNLHKMISELEAERDRLDHAIQALEQLSRRPVSKSGRPVTGLQKQGPEIRIGKEQKQPGSS